MSVECLDREWLREYLRSGSDGAFQKLVEAHGRMVIATARRVTGTPDSAEEIAQNVFIQLARKAHWLAGHESLAGWLHRAAVLEARQWLRSENRRVRREQHAYESAADMQSPPQTLNEYTGLLDDALLELAESDRQLVVLRHCEGRSYPEIARVLGLREDAARKRTDRAMAHVAGYFKKRGIAAAGMAAIIAGLDSSSAALSPAFAVTATKVALGAAPLASLGVIPSLVAKVMALSKVQTAALTLLIVAVPVAYEAGLLRNADREYAREISRLAEADSNLAQAEGDLRRAKLRFEVSSRRHDAAIADSSQSGARRGNGNSAWVDGLKYTRVPKSIIASLPPAGLDLKWNTRESFRQLLGLSPEEDAAVKQAVSTFTSEIARQNESHLKRIPNDPADENNPKVESATFDIEPHRAEAIDAARALESGIHQALGPERAQLALKQLNLPLLPDGTTDYENNPDVDNQINSLTAPSQGLHCRIVFKRDRTDVNSDITHAEFSYDSYGSYIMNPTESGPGGTSAALYATHTGASMNFWQSEWKAPVMAPTLVNFWHNWKSGAPEPQP